MHLLYAKFTARLPNPVKIKNFLDTDTLTGQEWCVFYS